MLHRHVWDVTGLQLRIGCHPLVTGVLELFRELRNFLGLLKGQLDQNFFGTSRDGHGAHLAIETFDLGSETRSGVRQTAKNLGSFSSAILHDLSAMNLQKRGSAAKLVISLNRRHGIHLVGDVFNPSVCRIDKSDHLSELPADHLVFEELLSESLAPVRELVGFFVEDAGETVGHAAQCPAFYNE